MNNISVTITIGNHSVIELEYEYSNSRIKARTEGNIDSRYIMLLSIIIESIKACEKGIPLNRYFDPTNNLKIKELTQEEEEPYYKLKWNKRGVLVPLGPTNKKFRHIEKPEEALKRSRVFTCEMDIVSRIPTKKIKKETNHGD